MATILLPSIYYILPTAPNSPVLAATYSLLPPAYNRYPQPSTHNNCYQHCDLHVPYASCTMLQCSYMLCPSPISEVANEGCSPRVLPEWWRAITYNRIHDGYCAAVHTKTSEGDGSLRLT